MFYFGFFLKGRYFIRLYIELGNIEFGKIYLMILFY